MNIEVLKIINLERERYVDFFLKETTSLKQDKKSFATELAIQVNDETLSYPFNIIRVDFITKDEKDEHKIFELRLDKNSDYETLESRTDNLQLIVNPFCWNSCEFQVDKLDINDLKEWLDKWFKIEEKIFGENLSIAIHSFSKPELRSRKLTFVIDFGTSTDTALIEFLEILKKKGATEIIIQTIEV